MAQNVNSYTINGTNIVIKGMTCLFYIAYCVLISCKHSKSSHYDCITLKLNDVELFLLLYSVKNLFFERLDGAVDMFVCTVGDYVRIRTDDPKISTSVAQVESLDVERQMVRIRWYYLPEETKQGRRTFHGIKEVLLSNHYDVRSIHTIQGKCVVYSLENYMNLKPVGSGDYFCRFEYNCVEKCVVDGFVDVECDCEMPYNPDLFMVQCDGCMCRFHPSCKGMKDKDAMGLTKFLCSKKCSDDDAKCSDDDAK
ncbi:putative chromatin regulator PHD family [Helianthus annuus]|nr:putative chromatin regulator PHD family [Helianthus annuus]